MRQRLKKNNAPYTELLLKFRENPDEGSEEEEEEEASSSSSSSEDEREEGDEEVVDKRQGEEGGGGEGGKGGTLGDGTQPWQQLHCTARVNGGRGGGGGGPQGKCTKPIQQLHCTARQPGLPCPCIQCSGSFVVTPKAASLQISRCIARRLLQCSCLRSDNRVA
jgi:hypothetical protein